MLVKSEQVAAANTEQSADSYTSPASSSPETRGPQNGCNMRVLSSLPATHALMAGRDKAGLRWRVELGKDEDGPISHNPGPRMHSFSQLFLLMQFIPPPRNEDMRRGRRASYAKVPKKQQLAHNK